MEVDNKISWEYCFGVIFFNSTSGSGFVSLLIAVISGVLIIGSMDFSNFILDENLSRATGIVTGIDTIHLSQEDKKDIIFEYRFTFRQKENGLRTGKSYFPTMMHQVEDSVTIRYLANTPSYAVIEGMQQKEKAFYIGAFVVPLLAYALGLYLLYYGIRKGKKLLNYADYGKATLARFMRREITDEQGEHGVIVRMIFGYETPNGKYEIFSKTDAPKNFNTKERIVLYFPWDNGDAIFKDDLWS